MAFVVRPDKSKILPVVHNSVAKGDGHTPNANKGSVLQVWLFHRTVEGASGERCELSKRHSQGTLPADSIDVRSPREGAVNTVDPIFLRKTLNCCSPKPMVKKIWKHMKNHGMVCPPPQNQKEDKNPSGFYHNHFPPFLRTLGCFDVTCAQLRVVELTTAYA